MTRCLDSNGRKFFCQAPEIYLQRNNRILELEPAGQDGLEIFVLGFAQDAEGEVYLLGNRTGVPFGDTGVVLRLAAARREHFRAHLRGDEEVEPVDTHAQGRRSSGSRKVPRR